MTRQFLPSGAEVEGFYPACVAGVQTGRRGESFKNVLPDLTQARFYPAIVTNCALNGVLSYTAIMLKIVITKISTLLGPLETLLLTLAVSDLGVGLLPV